MERTRKGFTLIELVVVTVIMGILASFGVPYYLKSVETSKATDAVAIGHMLANSYRMYLLDNPAAPLSTSLSNTCNAAACSTAGGACKLVACNYVAKQDWDGSSYSFTLSAPPPGGGTIVTARRKSGAAPGTQTATYQGWGYTFSDLGGGLPACAPFGGAPDCPSF